jgi:hypothetical protein
MPATFSFETSVVSTGLHAAISQKTELPNFLHARRWKGVGGQSWHLYSERQQAARVPQFYCSTDICVRMDSSWSVIVTFCLQIRFDSASHCNSSCCFPLQWPDRTVRNECACLLCEQTQLLLKSYCRVDVYWCSARAHSNTWVVQCSSIVVFWATKPCSLIGGTSGSEKHTASIIRIQFYNSASCCIQTLFTLNFTVFNATFCTSVLH